MAFNYLTQKYEFDFDSISFPIELSENVMRYLYHNNRGDSYRGKIEYEQFKSILNGDDRSYAACIIAFHAPIFAFRAHRIKTVFFYDKLTSKIKLEATYADTERKEKQHLSKYFYCLQSYV